MGVSIDTFPVFGVSGDRLYLISSFGMFKIILNYRQKDECPSVREKCGIRKMNKCSQYLIHYSVILKNNLQMVCIIVMFYNTSYEAFRLVKGYWLGMMLMSGNCLRIRTPYTHDHE